MSPEAARPVLVLAAAMDTEFHRLSAADVMLATVVTVSVLSTRYAVPVSVLCTTAEPVLTNLPFVSVAVGAVVSLKMAYNVASAAV